MCLEGHTQPRSPLSFNLASSLIPSYLSLMRFDIPAQGYGFLAGLWVISHELFLWLTPCHGD